MAKNTSIEARFSLNSTHLPQPIAESTCLNLNGCSWVNAPISPQHRSNSNGCLIQTPKSMTTDNVGRIDARTYTDIQSNGLTSRIVQYHNHRNGARLNRSSSMNALYSRPGQFPVVHLKKTEFPISANKKKQLSMTRIAPPEKSLFYGHTVSTLLRSNIVGSNQKNDRKFSHENRPIMHPPPTEDDTVPTRSVLEVLKEISRKRINSEDDESRMEATMKKYCNRESQEQLDSYSAQLANQQLNWQRTQYNNNYKRPREQKSLAHSPTSKCRTPPAQMNASPEQAAKSRRLSNFNNDITSSLSSSQIYAFKRKLYDSQLGKKAAIDDQEYIGQRYKMQRQKLPIDIATRTMSCDAVGGNYLPITPIPSTPQVKVDNSNSNKTTKSDNRNADDVPPLRTMSTPICVYKDVSTTSTTSIKAKPRVTLFNKNYEVEEKTSHSSNKDSSLSNDSSNNFDDENSDNSYAEIQFVKPKKGELLSGSKHPLIQRTQKSKLALMLCGLRGELYQGDEVSPPSTPTPTPTVAAPSSSADELDKRSSTTSIAGTEQKQDKITTTSTATPLQLPPTSQSTNMTAAGATTTPQTTTNQNTETLEKPQQQQAQQQLPVLNNLPDSKFKGFSPITNPWPTGQSSLAPVKKTTSPLVGIKLTPAKTMDNQPPASNDSNATTIAAAPTAMGNTNLNVGTFQFGVPEKTSMPTLKMGSGSFNFMNNNDNKNNNNNNTMEKPAPETPAATSGGIFQSSNLISFSTPNNKTTTNTFQTAAPVMAFNMPSSNATAISTTTAPTFLAPQPTLTATSTAATAPLGTSSTPFFNFGSEKSLASLNTNTTSTAPASAAPAAPLFGFNNNSGGTTISRATMNNNLFDAKVSNPTASTTPYSFTLNNSATKTADNNNAVAASGGFGFNNMTNNNNNKSNNNSNTNNNSGFVFGANATTSTASTGFGKNLTTTTTPGLGFNTNTADPRTPASSASSALPTFNLFNNQTTVTATTPATMTNFPNGADNKSAAKPTFVFSGITGTTTTPNNNNNNNNSSSNNAITTNNIFGVPTTMKNNNNNNNSNDNNNNASTTNNIFGVASAVNNNNNNNNTNTQGILKSNFVFGNSNNNANTAANQNNENKTPMGASNKFTFGDAANSATNKSFSFWNNNNNNSNNNNTNNNNSAQNIFGAANNTSTPTPTFSNVGQSAQNVSTVAPFSYDNKPMDNTAKPFTFGSGGPANNSAPSFGGATGNVSMFNYPNATPNQAGGLPALPSNPQMNNNNNNMFSPPPSNDRPIRRATRRLNK